MAELSSAEKEKQSNISVKFTKKKWKIVGHYNSQYYSYIQIKIKYKVHPCQVALHQLHRLMWL